jgi:hypothetical protein
MGIAIGKNKKRRHVMETKEESVEERCEVVVNSHEVATYSKRGYRTIAIVDEEFIASGLMNDHLMGQGMSYPTPVTKTVPMTQKILRFHMVKNASSRIAELSAEIDAMKTERANLDQKLIAAGKENVALKQGSDSLTRDIERRRVELEQYMKESGELRERLRKMESDISKFRKEIGEQRWREICEEPKK